MKATETAAQLVTEFGDIGKFLVEGKRSDEMFPFYFSFV
jgi:hypothetical protein